MAATVIRRLDLTGAAVPVVLGGGLLTARDPLLTAWITERLAAQAPQAQVRVVAVPPIAGAALLGLDRAGAAGRRDAAARRLPGSPASRVNAMGNGLAVRIAPW